MTKSNKLSIIFSVCAIVLAVCGSFITHNALIMVGAGLSLAIAAYFNIKNKKVAL